jgi:hypothetical protein
VLLGWRLTSFCTARSVSATPCRCPIAQTCELASRSGRTIVRWAAVPRLPHGAAVCTVTAEASRVLVRANDRARTVHQSRSEYGNGSHGQACLGASSRSALVWDEAHGDFSSANHVLTLAVRVSPRRRRGRPDRYAGRCQGVALALARDMVRRTALPSPRPWRRRPVGRRSWRGSRRRCGVRSQSAPRAARGS